MEPMIRAMYLSRARHRMSSGELSDLLAGARIRNTAHDITGILVYDAGYFIQLVEGPESMVRQLLDNVRRDPRHDEYQLLAQAVADERLFDGWAMDAAHLEFMDDARHTSLRRRLRESPIEDRASVYKAFLEFIEAHRRSR